MSEKMIPEKEILTPEQIRNKIRAVTVGAKKDFQGEIVQYHGIDIEFREPSERQRSAIFKRSQLKTGDKPEVDTAELTVWTLICCTYVPGSDLAVFTEADYESLMLMPASQLDALKVVALKYVNVDREKLVKNSGLTTASITASN